jgi:hypothetical protein
MDERKERREKEQKRACEKMTTFCQVLVGAFDFWWFDVILKDECVFW